MAEKCGVGKSAEVFKCHLRDTADPWLLIFDNADDPSLDIARYFPAGNRGTIILTTRNPQCKIHETVQSHEFGELNADDAVTLLLRASKLPHDEFTRESAVPVVQTLGHLALAIVHAGALIRQKLCTLDDYCEIYGLRRKDLLSRQPVQATVDYKYTVYTTWEISVASIKESAEEASSVTAANALDLLKLFGYLHFDNISEYIFERVWKRIPLDLGEWPWVVTNQIRMFREDRPQHWDPLPFREAVNILNNYSLIHLNGDYTHISLHPLVHSWIKDSLNPQSKLMWWTTGLSTLTLASNVFGSETEKRLESHIRSCLASGDLDDFLIDDQFAWDRAIILSNLTTVLSDLGSHEEALSTMECIVAFCEKTFSETPQKVCEMSLPLVYYYQKTHEVQKALYVLEHLPSWKDAVEDFVALQIMSGFSELYAALGRDNEALKWALEGLELVKKLANPYEDQNVMAKFRVACLFVFIGRAKKAAELMEGVVNHYETSQSGDIGHSLLMESILASAYSCMGEHQKALDLFEGVYLKRVEYFGDKDYDTLSSAAYLARQYDEMGRLDEGMNLLRRTIETGQQTGVSNRDLQRWKEWLEGMENDSIKAQQVEHKDKHRKRITTWFKDRYKPKLLE